LGKDSGDEEKYTERREGTEEKRTKTRLHEQKADREDEKWGKENSHRRVSSE